MADQYNTQIDPKPDRDANRDLGTNSSTDDYAQQGTGEGARVDTDTDLDADQYTSWNKGTYQYPRTGADPETGAGAGPDIYTPPHTPIVSGGEGLYGDEDEPRSEQNRDRHGNPYRYGSQGGPVSPGSSQDQYGTKGSQDQYGNQQ